MCMLGCPSLSPTMVSCLPAVPSLHFTQGMCPLSLMRQNWSVFAVTQYVLFGLCLYLRTLVHAAALGEMFTTSSQVVAIVLSAILGTLFMPKVYLLFCKKTDDDKTTIQMQTGQRASVASLLGGCTCHSGSTASTAYGCRRKTYVRRYVQLLISAFILIYFTGCCLLNY